MKKVSLSKSQEVVIFAHEISGHHLRQRALVQRDLRPEDFEAWDQGALAQMMEQIMQKLYEKKR